ncbi:DNA internalization-related competence protein ComEC/Rec2 [Methylobacter sp. YRD-M1]|uniref:DNA internalization-related competence protein ComEC/Rec2 n=1 Tax=Methylobacter sp. YRD-M1 TaxID=2911520 RepID=UPI00227B9208|nr:DNA internalization-related competence protein ComEC/Rec2 [Methylobacter sp. YRD-M1]WAK03659.1 DNA internalization-related competence protein ComEC/Rec2 [Methylobacter sp. YRD-M1]
MLVSTLLFLAGVLLVQQLPTLPAAEWLAAGAVIAGLMAWRRFWRGLFFMMGVLWAVLFAMNRLSDRLPQSLEGIDIPVKGIIADLPEQDEKRARFDFVVADSARDLPSKIKLSWYYPKHEIKAGQHWSFTVKLKRPHGNLNPGAFDYERWLFTEGIGATGYVRNSPAPVLLSDEPAWHSISAGRQLIIDRLSQQLGDSQSVALVKALAIGDGSSIPQEQWEVFRKTGTLHLMVISGSHIGLIAGLVYFVVLRCWAWTNLLAWPPQRVAALSALVAGSLYSALAGFSVPTQRAVVMLAIFMAAIVLQRNTHSFNTLAVALFAVLLLDPSAVLSAGFWLSFLAVAVIVYAVGGRLGRPGYLEGVIKINWATTVALSPLSLLFFQQISLIAPLANLIAVPVVSFLAVPLSLLVVITVFVLPALAGKLFFLVDAVLQGLWWILNELAAAPLSVINHAQPPLWTLCFAVPGVLVMLAPAGMPARWLGLIMFLPLAYTESERLESDGFRMTLLDVGQGLSAVVQTSRHVLVFDTGAKFSGQSDMGQSVLLPFLRQQGVEKIDSLIISHGDNDHIGGAESLLAGIETEQVLTSVPQQLSGHSPVACAAGQSWQWDGVTFMVLSPRSPGFVSENDNSCVLRIQSDKGSVLLTGDIEATAESWLVETYGEQLKTDVLIAAHHGSKTSSILTFLQSVQPDYVLIPAGYRNQFGFPHQSVLKRYQDIKAEWLNVAEQGAIFVDAGKESLAVHTMRTTASRYWNNH